MIRHSVLALIIGTPPRDGGRYKRRNRRDAPQGRGALQKVVEPGYERL